MPGEWEHAVAAVGPAWERRCGAAGRQAALELRERVARVAALWELTVGGPLATGGESVVVAVHDRFGRPGVLKCRPPADPGTCREALALTHLASPHVVPLMASAPADGVLWLSRVVPGQALAEERDDLAAADAWCEVASSLPRAADPTAASAALFPRLTQQLGALEAWQAALPKGHWHLAQRVVAVAQGLAATAPAPSLLHGDLHDENILSAGGGTFWAIDPKGVFGDPAYEPACLLMNRWMRPTGPPERLAAAVAQRLGLDARRVLGWTFVHTALSLAWSQEDDGRPVGASDPRWAVLDQALSALRG